MDVLARDKTMQGRNRQAFDASVTGLAAVCPILISGLMLHESATASTWLERTPGVIAAVLERYPLTKGDTLIVFSNSGVNAAPVEIAKIAKERGFSLHDHSLALYADCTKPNCPHRASGVAVAPLR